jgi:DNA-binding MarR family transcriptional regulator
MSTVNGIIDRLEAKKLVERKRTDPDRRKVLVSATDAGVMLSRNMPLPLQNGLVQAISELPELEQVSIALSLERIVDMMEEDQRPDSSGR